ncbi:hypothetical protein TVAG_289190 [Trichomonas vaginalis G3]|uniref:DnaK protein n=1 Tax=Trichomonas vaginalis (strain ATCC PRA-98 / G3) TaxID=412133 RepID=A2ERH4_TRIV3|nr:ATP binding [Trichomonas vaginalis G3]EAY04777.1 hypothetical protein TVAG_289190 [Trichomonas vaginalis G3]KAI5545752.1 ATP binding [Trichomonas vaginalis G3]|eukprot:XP_001317000.1 hypothetical protein [Trichomonas vaginalis G3]
MAKVPTTELTDLSQNRRLWGQPSLYYDERILISGLLPEIPIYRALRRINQTVTELVPQAKSEYLTIVVPKFYPQQERDSLAAMTKDNGFKPNIADCTKAAAYWYFLHNSGKTGLKREKVLFVFFGASNLQFVLIQNYKKGTTSYSVEKEYSFDDTIGGRDIDVAIADILAKKYNHTITPKIEQILLMEAKKIKEKLTIMDTVSGMIDSIDENGDFRYQVTLDNVLEVISPLLDRIKQTAQRIKKIPDKVYLLGGSSRIPTFQSIIKRTFKAAKVYTSMSKDEMLASAAAMLSAELSSEYQLPPLNYTSLKIYNMTVKTPDKTLPFEGIVLEPDEKYWVKQNGEYFPTGSNYYMIWNQAGENTTFRQLKDGRWRFQNPKSKLFQPWRAQLLLTGRKIVKQEDDRIELQKTINSMEQLLLQTTEVLMSNPNYTTQKERKLLETAAKVTNRWFLSQKTYNITTLRYRYKLLEDAFSSVFTRAQNAELLPQALHNLTQTIKFAKEQISKWSLSPKSKQPDRPDVRNILRNIIDAETWLQERTKMQKNLDFFDPPKLTWYGVKEQTDRIADLLEDVIKGLQGAHQQQQQPQQQQKEGVYVYPPESVNVNYNNNVKN